MISPSTIDRIRDLNIVEVISHYHEIKKAGTSWKGKSPWSNEKTPSFYVVPQKNLFKDFSSGKGGNAITFVMEFNKCGFVDAVKDIAGKLGEKIEYEIAEKATEDQDHREKLFKINEAAARRFRGALLDIDATHWGFHELINKRVFTPDTIAQWQIGYAPLTQSVSHFIGEEINRYEWWQFLTKPLREKALLKEAIELGLVRDKNGRTYDAFRDRIMFPVHDHHGRIVSFGGRAHKEDKFNAKYLNSNDSAIFKKSEVLFGLHFAAAHIRKQGFASLMEGYTDVISFHQAGYATAVATCGTALTDKQCTLLKKYCSKVVLFPDADPPSEKDLLNGVKNGPGERSALTNMDMLMQHGFEVGVVPMPKIEGRKVDPDELTRMFPAKVNEI